MYLYCIYASLYWEIYSAFSWQGVPSLYHLLVQDSFRSVDPDYKTSLQGLLTALELIDLYSTINNFIDYILIYIKTLGNNNNNTI